ncbi:uncharacterized protein DDB_G0284459 [Anoplophora glabripennis]|uniref:uncharacterized protein DDB_G0284459 n=1 Tax=Anoplophora glabripennis TaxID=217634 RepID=UPI000873F62D|nr:uncharacterized protein DDB_G0284459 [Anoplophora glabripennis]
MESSNEADLDVDMAEVKRVLDDANMFEPNMSKDNMLSYYKVLINSKSTASEEDHTRRLNESQEELMSLLEEENVENTPAKSKEKPFIPKAWTSEKKPSESALEHNNNENILEDNIDDIINDSPKDATKVTFGFNEMAKDSEYTITLITHELKFVPIQSTAKFLNAGTALKAKMLYAYHTKMNKMKTELARTSFYPAPLPKITSTTETFPSFSDSDVPATYTCRSGRQTKRKVYNYDDDDDSLDGITNKKVKNSDEQEWLNKSTPIKSTVRTHKKQETNKIGAEFKTESEDINKEKKNIPKKETRTALSRKLSNAEIMKRSNIFGDLPKRRCEAMFDKLKEEEEKKEKEEKTMEAFNKTLEKLDEENIEASSNEEIITVEDEEFVKRRVVPPLPRKLINRKRHNPEGLAPLDIKVNSPIQKKESSREQNDTIQENDTPPKSYLKKRPAIRKTSTSDSTEPLPSTSRTSKTTTTNTVICPICNGSFKDKVIMDHAATCGEDPTRSKSKISRITCEICDKVVDMNTEYEVHVKDCIRKKKEKD